MIVKSESNYIFHTELGTMLTTSREVEGYDIEDIIADRAFSEAQKIRFENLAAQIDINAVQGPRTIQSSYVPKE